MRNRSKPKWQTDIAKERIEILFNLAEKEAKYANRYVELARKIGMRYNVTIPKELKRKFCKHCYSYLAPGNAVHRTNKKEQALEILCKICGKKTRFPYRREKANKKL